MKRSVLRCENEADLVPKHDSPLTFRVGAGELPLVLSVKQAADILGVNLKTVYEAIRRNGLPAQRIGRRRIVILRNALLEWLSQGRVSPSEEDR